MKSSYCFSPPPAVTVCTCCNGLAVIPALQEYLFVRAGDLRPELCSLRQLIAEASSQSGDVFL